MKIKLLVLSSLVSLLLPLPAAAGGIDLRLTIVAPPGLHVQFAPEGVSSGSQPLLLELAASSDVPGSNLPCGGGRCYQLAGQGRIAGNVRGGIVIIHQQDQAGGVSRLVGRDPISWTFQPGTVADLVAVYGLDATGNLKLVDYRRTDVPLTPLAEVNIDPATTPLAGSVSLTETQTLTATVTTAAGSKDSSYYLGCGLFLLLIAGLVGVGWWRSKRKAQSEARAGLGMQS